MLIWHDLIVGLDNSGNDRRIHLGKYVFIKFIYSIGMIFKFISKSTYCICSLSSISLIFSGKVKWHNLKKIINHRNPSY